MDKIYIITYNHEDEDGLVDSLPVLRFGFFLNEEDAIKKAKELNKSIPEEVWKENNICYSHRAVFQAKEQ